MHFLESIPLLVLYAEIHFKFFPIFPSFLFRKQPEIIFDCPRRLGPDMDLPVSLMIHDCIRFPVDLTEVSISVCGPSFPLSVFTFNSCAEQEITHSLQKNLRAFIFSIPRQKLNDGEVHINAKAVIKDRKNKEHIILNDNFPTSSKLSFHCMINSQPLPASHICSYGDFHVHSSFSESHVEFGPPIELISKSAAASGLNFINITDHSYDLSCSLENYLINDSSLKRWHTFQHESKKEYPNIVLRGEEISCLNNRNQVVHLCGADLTEFIPGSLDGARRNPENLQQLTIQEVIDNIHRQRGIAFAAHPGSQKTLMQSIFLKRGYWDKSDCSESLDGFQACNGSFGNAWIRALDLWINMLKKGYRIALLAGNDAHGDFNRYRSIKTPFFSIFESPERYFGNCKTGLYTRCNSDQDVKAAVIGGKTFVTSGPYLSINNNTTEDSSIINRTGVQFETTRFFIHCISDLEFGRICQLKVYGLNNSENKEQIVFKKEFRELLFNQFVPVEWNQENKYRYVRAELHTITEHGVINKAFTSCCFNTLFT